jgi:hypothetical protein
VTTIAYIGNFIPERSTENAYRWAFEKLGCEVIPIQQAYAYECGPDAPWREISGRPEGAPLDLVLYTRTHDRTALTNDLWTFMWRNLEHFGGVTTASVHLDVFVGVKRFGMKGYEDPLFTTSAVFTPDLALAEYIDTDDTKHYWLPPAADVRDGDPEGEPIAGLAGKIAFVGSRYGTVTVHPEYPWRTKLLDWAHVTYGNDFYWYGGGSSLGSLRGKSLWDVYASQCIVLGDSCFAGQRPYYWSDRVPETTAHGGMLVHPEIEGLKESYPHIVMYTPGDLADLADTISVGRDLMSGMHPDDFDVIKATLKRETREQHTYVQRARSILDTLGLTP